MKQSDFVPQCRLFTSLWLDNGSKSLQPHGEEGDCECRFAHGRAHRLAEWAASVHLRGPQGCEPWPGSSPPSVTLQGPRPATGGIPSGMEGGRR